MSIKLQARRFWHLTKTAWLQAFPAQVFYGWPGQDLKIYAITGTDGKTTSSTLLYHVLQTSGHKTALISTVGAKIGQHEIETGFHVTSPQPAALVKLLRRCVDEKVEHVVLEVTSHGLWQSREWGVPVELAGLTNISPEHLDYFESWAHLVRAKSLLFHKAKVAVINGDDQSFEMLSDLLIRSATKPIVYRQQLPAGRVGAAIAERFSEDYNRWNAVLVWTMAQQIGVSEAAFIAAVKSFTGVPGRMEQISNNLGIKIVVDFAHTPAALMAALKALKKDLKPKNKLWAVYGAAGKRDLQKRPAMGRIGSELADRVILTAEDPRTEDVQVIIRQMKEGVASQSQRKIISEPDRRQAIKLALSQAKKGDVIGIFGKGHEKSMCFGKVELPWSDQAVVRELIHEL